MLFVWYCINYLVVFAFILIFLIVKYLINKADICIQHPIFKNKRESVNIIYVCAHSNLNSLKTAMTTSLWYIYKIF